MRPVLVLAVIIAASQSFAREKVSVHILDGSPTSEDLGNDFKIDRSLPQPISGEGQLPSIRVRDEAFKAAELEKEVSEMDDLAKDLLCLKVQRRPLSAVQKEYPAIKKNKLVLLKKALQKY